MYLLHSNNCLKCGTPINIKVGENATIIENKSGCNIINYKCPFCGTVEKVTEMIDNTKFVEKETKLWE